MGEKRHYTDDLTVNVSGLGVNGTKYHNNVTGIYALDGTQVAIDKNVTVTVKTQHLQKVVRNVDLIWHIII